jgi:integrase
MKKKTWPPIKTVTKNGKKLFLVDLRVGGRGERRYFKRRPEAKTCADQARIRRANQGTTALADDRLATYGWTVQRAVEFALAHLARDRASVPIDAAITSVLDAKEAGGRSEGYRKILAINLSKYQRAFEGRNIASITVAEATSFLHALKLAPGTTNTVRRDGSTLWAHAVRMGWAASNIMEATEAATGTPAEVGILTPHQAAALLAHSTDDETLVFHAIGLFAGLRVAEVGRLDWADVDFESGFITVTASKSKTRSRRLVPITGNLDAWIRPLAKRSGPIVSRAIRRHHIAAREKAKISLWPDNAMRHSFVSYRLALVGDAAKVALEAGHQQSVLFAHYRELVKPRDAKKYFGIKPSTSSKVVPMVASA